MALDNTVPQPAATETEQKSEQEAKNAGDVPETSIQKILVIVNKLNTRFPPQPEQERMPRSNTAPAKSDTGSSQSTGLVRGKSDTTGLKSQKESENAIPKLKRNLRLLEEDVSKLQELNIEVAEEVRRQIRPLDNLLQQVELDSAENKLTEGNKNDLEKVNKKIFNLMCQVPLLPNKRKNNKGLDSEDGDGDNNGKGIVCLPGIHETKVDLKRRAVFRDVLREFEQLGALEKICLLSFAVFPENQEVNRTMLMYWWIGEGILPEKLESEDVVKGNLPDNLEPEHVVKGILPDKLKSEGVVKGSLPDKPKPEDIVKEILEDFKKRNLIEPVVIKRKVEPNSYKMTPFVHSSVVLISKEMELFDIYQDGKRPAMKQSALRKVCLVEGSSSQPEAKAKKMRDAEQIETVFNVSERFPDFTFKWFSKDQPSGKRKLNPLSTTIYKELKVFYLGRWERTATRHIEVENPELMKNLKHMTQLKLLSFQGISRIERLDDAVCKLHELIILDLRACYNLEKLPDKIDSLKALIYLDITDCYMIDRMPKRLSWLDNLEVLKGFVVSDADEETVCTLAELKHLKRLRKLSITINKGGEFSVSKLFLDIEDFNSLEKLKVAWGGINEHKIEKSSGGLVQTIIRTVTFVPRNQAAPDPKKAPKKDSEKKATKKKKDPERLPKNLKKLDLQCFPDPDLPLWLQPHNLGGLEKLYIKGGTKLTKLTGIGSSPEDPKPTNCKVKVLRLKFLPRLKVEWRELTELYFPELEFLDKYQCPQVSFCPCDGIGIWRKNKSKEL